MNNHANVVHELLTWPEHLELQRGAPHIKSWFETLNVFKDSVFHMAKEYADSKIMIALYQFQITWILSDIPTLSKLNDYFNIHKSIPINYLVNICQKKTEFIGIENDEILAIQKALNNRFRKVLNYRTPNEVMRRIEKPLGVALHG